MVQYSHSSVVFLHHKNMKHKHSTSIHGFLAFLFIAYWVSSTLLSHTHVVNNTIITHSHPFSSKSHSHTQADWIWNIHHQIGQIIVLSISFLLCFSILTFLLLYRNYSIHIHSHKLEHRHRRPPPLFL